jgi:hypothetical protein
MIKIEAWRREKPRNMSGFPSGFGNNCSGPAIKVGKSLCLR